MERGAPYLRTRLTPQMFLIPALRGVISKHPAASARTIYPMGVIRHESTLPRAPATANNPVTTHYRVTLRRSAIGLPKYANRVLESLGLHKRLQSVYHPQNAGIAGAILAVKELVHVENVRALSPGETDPTASRDTIWVNASGEVVDAGRVAFKAPKGYRIVGNLMNEKRDSDLKRRLSETSVQ